MSTSRRADREVLAWGGAIFALFAASVFRGQAEKAIGRLEGLIAAAQQGFGTAPKRN